jgi:UDP-N-acetylglucosamine diphosphorylase / glucose-1-phosphate thymidylyltransferase / UDP-N-acetylgalactosamine diphosphorylase / glucosamine-1-phosphate N-acetyltransferase / galactosamine-1-phosphate N-acetyltransferase
MSIVFFEDTSWKNFEPLSHTRSLFDLKIGSLSSFEHFNIRSAKFLTRQYLEKVTNQRHSNCNVNKFEYNNDDIFLTSLFIPLKSFFKKWRMKNEFLISFRDKILMGRLKKSDSEYLYESIVHGKEIRNNKLTTEIINVNNLDKCGILYCWPWDFIFNLRDILCYQLKFKNKVPSGVKVIGKNPVCVDKTSKIDEGTILDVSDGGIYIGPHSVIHQSSIYGPAYVGQSSQIKPYSIINNSYIGNNCRIGGEIDSSIILDYTNKSHLGYLGHSYIGDWVNIGANTITSDLKMTYGTISVKIGNEKRDTRTIKLGSFFGDMAKTSIGTNIYCGVKIGVSSHIYGNIPNDVPSYIIYGKGIGSENAVMDISLAIKFQKRMMSRRNVNMSLPYETMMRTLFEMTKKERKEYGVRSKRFAL